MALAEFSIISTTNGSKCYGPGQLVFGRDMIIPIKNKEDWGLILQQKQIQINKDSIRKNIKRVDHDYKVGDKVMLNNHAAYKYETPYKGPFEIKQFWGNGMVSLQCGETKIRYNIRCIKPYTSDTNAKASNPEKYV